MCWQYPEKLGAPRSCGVTRPPPALCGGLGEAFFLLGMVRGTALLGMVRGTVLLGSGCFFLGGDGDADGDAESVASGLAEICCVLGAGAALKPRLEADPLPGATTTKAATMMPARASGPAPNSRTFISAPRSPQDSERPPGPADLPGRDLPGPDLPSAAWPGPDLPGPDLPGLGRPGTRRRGGADGLAKGPAVGVLGYQPTEAGSSGSGSGAGAASGCGGGRVGGGAGAVARAGGGGTGAVVAGPSEADAGTDGPGTGGPGAE